MNKKYHHWLSVFCLGLLIQTTANAEINDGIGHKVDNANSAVGSVHGAMPDMGKKHPALGKGQMPAKMPMMPTGPKKQGKVVEVTNGAGYSYMLIESNNGKLWVAGTQISAQVGDTVSYIENVTMNNFTSKTLKRTFDTIVFASMVAVVN